MLCRPEIVLLKIYYVYVTTNKRRSISVFNFGPIGSTWLIEISQLCVKSKDQFKKDLHFQPLSYYQTLTTFHTVWFTNEFEVFL